MNDLKTMFTSTYIGKMWDEGGSVSGAGSSLQYTEHIRTIVLDVINKNNIQTIWDCSCGDWNWMKEIKDKLPNYIGNDIVTELVELNTKKYGSDNIKFQCGDMLEELKKLEDGSIDLVICRHTLEHLATEYSVNVVREIHRVAKWAIITSIDAVNTQLRPNGITARSVNLEKNEYYTILGDPFKRYWDSMGEPPTENSFNMNLYCFKN
jgi:ubiquinone/menaquinone biosynthesis C-methylase UbiE